MPSFSLTCGTKSWVYELPNRPPNPFLLQEANFPRGWYAMADLPDARIDIVEHRFFLDGHGGYAPCREKHPNDTTAASTARPL